MALKITSVLVTLWALAATAILCFFPETALDISRKVRGRETVQGRLFLARDTGPEGFTAFGNENYVFCARPCTIQESDRDGEGLFMCESRWDGRKHLCSARLWPDRQYVVQAKKQ